MYRFLIVIEKAGRTYSAYAPDLPGCVATGKTHEAVEARMHEAVALHIQGLQADGLPIPKSTAVAEIMVVHA